MNGVARALRILHRIFGILGGAAAVLVCGLVFLVGVGMHERGHDPTGRAPTGMDSAPATEPVTITMGKVVLRIPRNYFLALPAHDIPERPDGVEFILLGLMPDFEPRTEANRAEFNDFHGFGRKLKIFVQYNGPTMTGKNLFAVYYNSKDGPVRPGEYGYQSFQWIGDDQLFRGDIENPRDFIQCRRKDQVAPPGEAPIPYFPSCKRIVLVGDGIVAELVFSRDYLGKAHDIEAQAIDALNRFRISGPPLETIQ
ncbi:hypothetical protein [Zavarzinia compransoris]|uniref:Uncharacterized protein n=1 Tax=Zavarzinia compransoris TaxID=1264899 RepID=A0A317E248_9PROT|nr:hypothetical protein [Zavarzinia compransoris]PWR21059.1 hypothetical protein DKG75_13830 [Zavarzinia compransoris]TDP44096.1 hypothetical protein DES42_108144 [Zavarzinia compransoris]